MGRQFLQELFDFVIGQKPGLAGRLLEVRNLPKRGGPQHTIAHRERAQAAQEGHIPIRRGGRLAGFDQLRPDRFDRPRRDAAQRGIVEGVFPKFGVGASIAVAFRGTGGRLGLFDPR
ncbi:MAG: hypothetical protein ACOYXU_13685 [Nitrospirota bacterium]